MCWHVSQFPSFYDGMTSHSMYFVHSFIIDGYLSCFHLLAAGNHAAMNMVYKYLKTVLSILLGVEPEAEFRDHMAILWLIFGGITKLLPQRLHQQGTSIPVSPRPHHRGPLKGRFSGPLDFWFQSSVTAHNLNC